MTTELDHVAETSRRTRRRSLLVGGILPLLISIIAAIVMISWLPELPDPVAIHWGSDGVNGFGSPWALILMPIWITVLFSALAVGSAAKTTALGLLSWTQKFVLATAVWMGVALSLSMIGTLAMQRGMEDARDAEDVGLIVLVSFGIAIVVAVLSWFVLPATDANPHATSDPREIVVGASERVTWSRTVTVSRVALFVIVGALLLSIAAMVATGGTSPEALLSSGVLLAVILLLALTTTYWRVTADHRGLSVRSPLGWPRVTIAPGQIRDVHVVEVNPMGDFGGWGWRWGGQGRSGIIMRAGSAIEVTRDNGKRFVVTVDDAETGAGVLAALIR